MNMIARSTSGCEATTSSFSRFAAKRRVACSQMTRLGFCFRRMMTMRLAGARRDCDDVQASASVGGFGWWQLSEMKPNRSLVVGFYRRAFLKAHRTELTGRQGSRANMSFLTPLGRREKVYAWKHTQKGMRFYAV